MMFDILPRKVATLEMTVGQDLRHLPQFFRADQDMAWRLGGSVVQQILSTVGFSRRWRHVSIDSRVHMLMKGMYPCIPGWHCDDFYRGDDGQPDLINVMERAPAEHVCIILGDCSRTVFQAGAWEWRIPSYSTSLYAAAHKAIEAEAGVVFKVQQVNPGELWWFSPITWHRGSPATKNGWRYFLRVTGSDHWEPKNELRTQTQVYMTDPFQGW